LFGGVWREMGGGRRFSEHVLSMNDFVNWMVVDFQFLDS
jgi:hypothetical protein